MRKLLISTSVAMLLASLASTRAEVKVQAWYKLGEDGAGTDNLPKDSSGNGHNFLTESSSTGVAVSSVNPPPGGSKYYTFSGELTGFSDIGWNPPEDNVGVECWARSADIFFDTFTSVGSVVWGTGNNQNGLDILYNDFGGGFIGAIGNVDYVGLPYQPATTNEWVHLAVVRDSGITTFYVNGVARTPTRTGTPVDSTMPFMAYTTDGSKTNFAGAIDDARIFTFVPGEFYPKDLLFYQATNTAPYVTTLKGAVDGFTIKIQDKTTTLDQATISLSFDSAAVTNASVTKSGTMTTVKYTASSNLAAGSSHTVSLVFADSAGVYQTNNMSFNVVSYLAVSSDFATADGAVDTTKPGFRVRPFQTEAAQPNTLAWTEDQLLGLQGANVADLSGADAQGFYDVTTVVNFNIEAGSIDRGNFGNDQNFPGIPGTLGTGNSSMEVLTFLKFSAAGAYQMGVNSDDGFKVTTGKNPRDRFAVVLGQFDGGRGASDSLFTFVIPQAGIYPFRLIWENGSGELPGNQASCEWFTMLDDGTKVLINDTQSPIKAYRQGPLPTYVSRIVPGNGELGVTPGTSIQIDLTDGSVPLKAGSIQLALNGAALAAPTSVNKTGSVTTATLTPTTSLVLGAENTVQVVWSDTANNVTTNSWQFSTLNATLPASLWTAVGSGDKTKPGFRVRTYQVDQQMANGAMSGITTEVPVGNTLLQGIWGPNIANLSSASNGEFAVPGVINWNRDAGVDIGGFQSPDYPDAQIPGIPGMGANGESYENFAVEAITYIEFPTNGVFTMGVNSDDGFRVTANDTTGPDVGAVRVLAPASKAGSYVGLATYAANGGLFGGPWPRPTPIMAPLVVANDGTTANNNDGVNLGDSYMFLSAAPVNADQLKGNIAVSRRGGGITFSQKARFCQDAGALAVILVNRADQAGQWPWGMGGSDPGVTIPCIMVDWNVWTNLMADATTNASTTKVTLSLGDDSSLMLGQYDGGRGEGTPTLFTFYVPQAGVYPMRLMYFQGQGGANCEWFSVDKAGNRILVNDSKNSGALKAYRARTASPVQKPTLGYSVNAGNLVLTFTGRLQSADTINGSFTDVANASSPMTVPMTAKAKFYRAAQ